MCVCGGGGGVFQLTSRVLCVLLRQYLGDGLRCLRLRGLLLSARRGAFLTESWLQTLRSKCPRLHRLCLQHTGRLRSCSLLPPSLELRSCEVPAGFFTQDPGKAGIEKLIVESVPSFSDQHLRSLCSWRGLRRLELRELMSAGGLENCAQTLDRLTQLELEPWSRTQMVALGLGRGWRDWVWAGTRSARVCCLSAVCRICAGCVCAAEPSSPSPGCRRCAPSALVCADSACSTQTCAVCAAALCCQDCCKCRLNQKMVLRCCRCGDDTCMLSQ